VGVRKVGVAALVVGVAVAVAVSAGCSSSTPAAAPAPSRLSPPITLDQLDLSGYLSAPCGLLRPDQLAQRGMPAGAASGGVCRWAAVGADRPEVSAQVTHAPDGLEQLYRRHPAYFQPTSVGGYPAVESDDDPAAHTHGRCTVHVAVANDTLLSVTASYGSPSARNYGDPCPDAEILANTILGKVKADSP
jgi:hypothetical protein